MHVAWPNPVRAAGSCLGGVPRGRGIGLIKATRCSAVVNVLADQIMLTDVADIIRTEHRSWANFLLDAEVHLLRTRRAVVRIKEVMTRIQR